jgi:Zn-dependent metalloprotease
MATFKGHLALSFVTAVLAAGSLSANILPEAAAQRVRQSSDRLLAQRSQLGLDADHAFTLRSSHADELGQTHGHFAQHYKGVRVFGGDAITHANARGVELPLTNALHKNINLNVTPSLNGAEVLAIVHQHMNPQGSYTYEPTAELVVFPATSTRIVRPRGRTDQELDATMVQTDVVRFHLAYHVQTVLLSKADNFAKHDFIVDAHTGAILQQWDSLETTAATGTGNSQYNGTVSIQTNYTGTTYELRDMTRGTGGQWGANAVTNMNHTGDQNTGSPTLYGTVFTDADNTWGDGANYIAGGSTTSANGQTAAVDAAFGVAATWDMYKNVLGRNGIDGTGKATYSRVHFSTSFDNAFWLDQCFCMSYGDGSSFKSLEALDVAGHELSHGVCATTANLTYSGESGGLNEANSDIFGALVEFYQRSGGGTTIGSTGGNWTIGEQLATTPLRYMYKPSLDGSSPDAWSSTIGNLNVHYSSGPMNRCFYFLSQGATTTGNTSTTYLPSGMTGIGNDHAARIWFRTLTTYLTSSSNYAAARAGAISAAKDLYGAGSAEEQAVWNAFHGINVGAAWSSTPPPPTSTFPEVEANNTAATANAVARTYTNIQGNITATADADFFALTMNPGETLALAMTGPTGVDWDLKLLNSAGTQLAISQGSTATENVSYTNTGTTAITVYADVYAYSGTSATPYNLALTYSGGTPPPPADTTAPTVSATETGTSGTITFNATASDNVGVSKVEFYVDGTLKGTDTTSPYSLTLDSTTLTNATHTLVAKAYDAAGNVGTSTSVNFTVSNTTTPPSELVLNGGFESGATSWTGTTAAIGTFTGQPAFEGTKCAWLGGNGTTTTEYLYQNVAIPSTVTSATLTFQLHIDTAETTTATAYDKLTVTLRNTAGTTLTTLATYSNLNKAAGYALKTFDVTAYKGQTVRVYFNATEDSSLQTSFVVDKVSLATK